MMWILLEPGGRILRTGDEPDPHIQLGRILETRFPGICTAGVTLVPWRDLDDEPMHDSRGRLIKVACVWLAVGLPFPDECQDLSTTPITKRKLGGSSNVDIDAKACGSDPGG